MPFNYFGATEAALLRKFALAGYTPAADDFGGATAIADALADATHALVQTFPLVALEALQRPDLCLIEARGTAGQTAASFPAALRPAVVARVHVWRGMPSAFTSRPGLETDAWLGEGGYGNPGSPTPSGSICELPAASFVATASGITLTDGLARNEQVYASWDVNVDDAAYSVPSVADWVLLGAAAATGAKHFPQASAGWALVSGMAEEWGALLEALGKGTVTPAGLRALRWWQAPERAQDNTIGSVRRYRA